MSSQRLATSIIAAAMLAALLSVATPAGAATDPAEQEFTFSGGGWGHGVGMSQYGALGRAEAGFTAEEIVGFYYEDTQLLGAADLVLDPTVVVDDVDVRVGTANCSGFTPTTPSPSPITIAVDGTDIGSTTEPFAIGRSYVPNPDGGGKFAWQIVTGPGAGCSGRTPTASPVVADLCGTGCVGAFLTITFTDGEPISISAADRNGGADRSYAHGQIQLLPDGRKVPGRTVAAEVCGNPVIDDFCIVVGNMTMQQYLYGLAEVPASWHIEALRSQAIAGRSYALSRIAARVTRSNWNEPFNVYASTKDQYYVGWNHEEDVQAPACDTCRWLEAVDLTDDIYVADLDGVVATTFYSSSNGGFTNANEDFYSWAGWSRSPISYLRANRDPYDDHASNPNAFWERSYSLSDISRWLADYPFADLDVGTVERISITQVPESGYIDYALVTVYGSARTLEIRRGRPSDDGYDTAEPFGYRFWYALRLGCNADPGCSSLVGHRVRITTFFDVDPLAYFGEAVRWMTLNDLSGGTGPNEFSPGLGNDRATIAAFLWRWAGSPTPVDAPVFEDVAPGSYYETAVRWMAAESITMGTTETTFSPEMVVTRAQAAAFLWRFAGRPVPTNASTFDDVPPGIYYETAVQWMVEWGITLGTTETTFSPDATLTRGDIATFMWRLAAEPGAFADGAAIPLAMRAT